MKPKTITGLAIAVIMVLMAVNAGASVTIIDGTEFKNTLETRDTRLHLKGTAMLRYLIFIDAYAGALYLPEEADGIQALDDIAKHLVLEYRVSISAQDFADATLKKIKEGVSDTVFQRILPQIEALNRLYKDVEPEDRYALTYIPGVGTQLALNTVPLGTIEGAEFARAMFGIWIGNNPIDKYFRDRLLGIIK